MTGVISVCGRRFKVQTIREKMHGKKSSSDSLLKLKSRLGMFDVMETCGINMGIQSCRGRFRPRFQIRC